MDVTCTVTTESWPTSQRRTIYKDCKIILGRNEFRDLTLKVVLSKSSLAFSLTAVRIHRRFLKEGKVTFVFPDQHTQLLVSNAPPHRLKCFVGTVLGKSVEDESNKENNVLSIRSRMLSEKVKAFEDISPLTDVTKESERKRKLEIDGTTPRKPTKFPTRPAKTPLTSEQGVVLKAVSSGRNVFFTGGAGTGKSFLLKQILGRLPPEGTVATATTGVAAALIGGITLHAFAGIGTGSADLRQCIELAERRNIRQQWLKCQHLVVDEVSMLDGDFFDKLEAVGRHLRRKDKPFGGIQLILCGDFLQLPPVTKGKNHTFCFQSRAWNCCVDVCLELTIAQRQSNDPAFAEILQMIRLGQCPESVSKTLAATKQHRLERDGICATRLCTHTEDVDATNLMKLDKLPGEPVLFQAKDNDTSATRILNSHCPVGEVVKLKIGTQVMLTKNLDVQKGLVNGARGVVTAFQSGLPVIRFLCGVQRVIGSEKFTLKLPSGLFLWRQQIPLKLAWAISIHKSQGMTLDSVEMSLQRVFECGQAYVALSRARSLAGLRVLDFAPSCVRAHPDVVKFYRTLQRSTLYS